MTIFDLLFFFLLEISICFLNDTHNNRVQRLKCTLKSLTLETIFRKRIKLLALKIKCILNNSFHKDKRLFNILVC